MLLGVVDGLIYRSIIVDVHSNDQYLVKFSKNSFKTMFQENLQLNQQLFLKKQTKIEVSCMFNRIDFNQGFYEN